MSGEYQQDIKDRMQKEEIDIPQLFVNGHHIGVSVFQMFQRRNLSHELWENLETFSVHCPTEFLWDLINAFNYKLVDLYFQITFSGIHKRI